MDWIRKATQVRTVLLVSVCSLASVLSPSPASAEVDLGVRGGAYTDEEKPFLGAEGLFNLGEQRRWFGNPNLEHAFVDNGNLTTVSMDFHYDFVTGEPFAVWAGAGPTLIFRDRDRVGNDDDTDPGVNLLVGVGAEKGDVRPYGQLKVIVADDPQAVLAAGIRF
jgi:hypothetical protein